jgi:hypothetical protein
LTFFKCCFTWVSKSSIEVGVSNSKYFFGFAFVIVMHLSFLVQIPVASLCLFIFILFCFFQRVIFFSMSITCPNALFSCNCMAREQKKVDRKSISSATKNDQGPNYKVIVCKASWVLWALFLWSMVCTIYKPGTSLLWIICISCFQGAYSKSCLSN